MCTRSPPCLVSWAALRCSGQSDTLQSDGVKDFVGAVFGLLHSTSHLSLDGFMVVLVVHGTWNEGMNE
jgi:hypothetical protein